ncbi:MAG: glycosyltransferase family 2 protein [Lysobacteraceae bacterium]
MSQFTIIVPAYGAVDALERCLLSVSENTASGICVFLADDASPGCPFGGLVATMTRSLGSAFRFVRRPVNLGFVANVNCAMTETAGDVVLLNSDTVVTPGWLDRLMEAFASDPRIATATPWSNNAEICSVPNFCRSNPMPEDGEVWAKAALLAGSPTYPDLPTGVGFCMAIRRAAWDQVGGFDQATFGRGYGEENDFCLRVAGHGWRNVLCDNAFVAHEGGVSFSSEGLAPGGENLARLVARYPDYNRRVAEFIMADPLRARREAVVARYHQLSGRTD